MTLRNRLQIMELSASAAAKNPAEMTLAELCDEIVAKLESENDRLLLLLQHLPDDVLQRQLEGLKHATETGNLALVNGAELSGLVQACAERTPA